MENKIYSCSNFFKKFIYSPESIDHCASVSLLTMSEKTKLKVAHFIFKYFTLGAIPFVCRYFFSDHKIERLKGFYQSAVEKATDPWKGKEWSNKLSEHTADVKRALLPSKNTPCDQILGELYLGNDAAFVESTCIAYTGLTPDCRPTPIQTTNSMKFKAVITVCPLQAIVAGLKFSEIVTKYEGSLEKAEDGILQSYEKNQITWKSAGKTTCDSVDETICETLIDWKCLVLDSTKPLKEKVSLPLDDAGKEILLNERVKSFDEIQNDPSSWFEPIFKELDKAVFEGKKTLVHCQAGQSRSASVLAAYLINRFNLSSDAAIAYLRTKRLCVCPNPAFRVGLNQYAIDLQTIRSP
jgi:hypothetical protein